MKYIYLNGPVVSGFTAQQIRGELRAARSADPAEPVTVVINSEGGDVYEGLAVYNLFRAEHVDVLISGMAASIASVIAMAGDRVAMYANSLLFVHHAWTLGEGNAAQLQETIDQLKAADRALVDAYAAKSGLDREKLESVLDGPTGKGSSLTAEDAHMLGLVDEVLDPAQAVAAMLKSQKLSAISPHTPTNQEDTMTPEDPEKTVPVDECGGSKKAEEIVEKEVETEVEKKEDDDRIAELEKKVEELSAKLAKAEELIEAKDAKLAAQAKFRAVVASAASQTSDAPADFPAAVKKIGFVKACEKYPELRKQYMKARIQLGSIR